MPGINNIYTIVIADDHEIIRNAIHDYLLRDVDSGNRYDVVGFAENGLDTISLVKSNQPDILFLDITMPLANGSEIIHDIRRWSNKTKILVFTGITAPGLLASIVEGGVDGLFSKASSVTTMFKQLPIIMRGGHYISPEFVAMIEQCNQSASLTQRERQILNLVVSGKTNKEVAAMLNISPKTVDKHRTNLMAKLDVHSISQLMSRALKDGLLDQV